MDKNEEMVRFSGIFAWIFGFSFVMNIYEHGKKLLRMVRFQGFQRELLVEYENAQK